MRLMNSQGCEIKWLLPIPVTAGRTKRLIMPHSGFEPGTFKLIHELPLVSYSG
jgi:hypothetical protein